MKTRYSLMAALAICVLAFGAVVPEGHAVAGQAFVLDPAMIGLSLLGAGLVTPANAENTQLVLQPYPWQRIREDSFNFMNVGTAKATGVVPRYDRTLHGVLFELGGTAFTHAMISAIRVKLGSTTIHGPFSAAELNSMNAALGEYTHGSFLWMDFTDMRNKNVGGEMIGGWDLTRFRKDVDLTIEVESSGYTAPTLKAHLVWGQPQPRNNVIKQLLNFGYALSSVGMNSVYPDFQGSDVGRLFLKFGSTKDWNGAGVTAGTATAWSSNTGNGAMGAVTVKAGAQVGTHKIIFVEPISNAGTFVHQRPDGVVVSKKGQVAAAFDDGELAFTIADDTDYLAGDGFDIVVKATNQGNINRFEIKKDNMPIYDREDQVARFEQRRYGLVPQSQWSLCDLIVERNHLGLLRTKGAKSLQINLYATETDQVTMFAEVYRNLDTDPL